jgi:hypothetical protein
MYINTIVAFTTVAIIAILCFIGSKITVKIADILIKKFVPHKTKIRQ